MSIQNVFNNNKNIGFSQGLIIEYTHDTKKTKEVKESNETVTRNEDGELFLPSHTHYLNVTGRRYCSQAPKRKRTVARTTPTSAVAVRNSTIGINLLNIVNLVANYRHKSQASLEQQKKGEQLMNFKLQQK